MVVIGDRLGLYRAMAGAGPMTPASWPTATGTAERYVREWLGAQAAAGYVDLRRRRPLRAARRARHPPHRRVQPGLRDRRLRDGHRRRRRPPTASPRRSSPARASSGATTTPTSTPAASGSSGPGYVNFLTQAWIPALDGVEDRLQHGIAGGRHRLRPRRLHHPHGPGLPGVDLRRLRPPRRVDRGGPQAAPPSRASADRVTFEVATAKTFDGRCSTSSPSSTACTTSATRSARWPHVREHLAAGGTILIVEPMAGDDVEDNLNPVGAAYYGFSTLLCTPNSLSQETRRRSARRPARPALRRWRPRPGSSSFRRVAETPVQHGVRGTGLRPDRARGDAPPGSRPREALLDAAETAAGRGRLRRHHHPAAGRAGGGQPRAGPLLLRLDGGAAPPGRRAVHRCADRPPDEPCTPHRCPSSRSGGRPCASWTRTPTRATRRSGSRCRRWRGTCQTVRDAPAGVHRQLGRGGDRRPSRSASPSSASTSGATPPRPWSPWSSRSTRGSCWSGSSGSTPATGRCCG